MKYAKYPIKFWPPSVWTSHMPTTISVRRRSMPRKQSRYLTPSFICFSIESVYSIIAIVSSGSKLGWFAEVRRSKDFLAASLLPCRTYHHGDLQHKSALRYTRLVRCLLRSENDARQDRDRPYLLHSEWYAIGPLIVTADGAFVHGSCEELSYHPTHVDEGRQVWPQCHGRHLGRIRWCHTLEGAPWDA